MTEFDRPGQTNTELRRFFAIVRFECVRAADPDPSMKICGTDVSPAAACSAAWLSPPPRDTSSYCLPLASRSTLARTMIVDDGVIEKMFIEPDVDGDPFAVSDAETMLQYLNPGAVAEAEHVLGVASRLTLGGLSHPPPWRAAPPFRSTRASSPR